MKTTLRTKFRVDVINVTLTGTSVHLSPVIEGSDENVEHFKKLPVGGVELIFSDPEDTKQFTMGDYVYVDFSPAAL